jgi:hypothetical protein
MACNACCNIANIGVLPEFVGYTLWYKRGAKGKCRIYACILHKPVNLKRQPLELSKYIILSFQLAVLEVTEFVI